MAFSSLRDFIFEKLEPEGRLVRVSEPVSTVLEMTERAESLSINCPNMVSIQVTSQLYRNVAP